MASEEKKRLEEKQRAARKNRKSGDDWKTRWVWFRVDIMGCWVGQFQYVIGQISASRYESMRWDCLGPLCGGYATWCRVVTSNVYCMSSGLNKLHYHFYYYSSFGLYEVN